MLEKRASYESSVRSGKGLQGQAGVARGRSRAARADAARVGAARSSAAVGGHVR